MSEFLTTRDGRRIAYHRLAGRGPGVVFLGGFKSDMTGTKAMHLQSWAERSGCASTIPGTATAVAASRKVVSANGRTMPAP